MTDLDLEKTDEERQLAVPPLGRSGFPDRLRRSVLARLEAEEAGGGPATRQRGPRPGRLRAVGTAGVAAMLFGLFAVTAVWWWRTDGSVPASVGGGVRNSVADGVSGVVRDDAEGAGEPEPSGLLLGLRHEPTESYRTVWIVRDKDGRIRATAQIGAIVAPFGMEFWRIDPVVSQSGNTRVRSFVAASVPKQTRTASRTDANDGGSFASGSFAYREIPLFVGNRFASFAALDATGKTMAVRVSAFPLLRRPADPAAERDSGASGRFLTPDEAFALVAEPSPDRLPSSLRASYDWAIVREPGRWVGRFAEMAGNGEGAYLRRWREERLDLPEALVSHDRFCCEWAVVRAAEPNARDAFSSPAGDWLAVVTPSAVAFYAVFDGVPDTPRIGSLELRPGELPIMAQWATGEYVAKWTEFLTGLG